MPIDAMLFYESQNLIINLILGKLGPLMLTVGISMQLQWG